MINSVCVRIPMIRHAAGDRNPGNRLQCVPVPRQPQRGPSVYRHRFQREPTTCVANGAPLSGITWIPRSPDLAIQSYITSWQSLSFQPHLCAAAPESLQPRPYRRATGPSNPSRRPCPFRIVHRTQRVIAIHPTFTYSCHSVSIPTISLASVCPQASSHLPQVITYCVQTSLPVFLIMPLCGEP